MPPPMRIFISQSGPRSQALAEILQPFIRQILPNADLWMAPTGIEKGTRYAQELTDSLRSAGGGLICLTPENRFEPWIHFETGVLSRPPASRVWPFLLDVTDDQLGPQLGQFQNTKATQGDVLLMIKSMNTTIATAMGGEPRPEGDVESLFRLMWPSLEERIAAIKAMAVDAPVKRRLPEEVMADVLSSVRDAGRQGANDSWRVAKTLALVGRLYQKLTGEPAPSMNELAELQRLDEAAARLGSVITIPPGKTFVTGGAPFMDITAGAGEALTTRFMRDVSKDQGSDPPQS